MFGNTGHGTGQFFIHVTVKFLYDPARAFQVPTDSLYVPAKTLVDPTKILLELRKHNSIPQKL